MAPNHSHQAKTMILLAITLIFGIVSMISLVSVIKNKKQIEKNPAPEVSLEQTFIEDEKPETTTSEKPLDGDFVLEKEVAKLDNYSLEKIEEYYSGDLLEDL